MRSTAMQIITTAAQKAGLPEGRVMDVSASDNLTLARPRVEVDFLPDSFTRTGRKLHVVRHQETQTIKKELYEVRFDLTAHVYADNAEWLEGFEYLFVAAMPPGVEDVRGNWIKVRVNEATFSKEATKRVGTAEIKVFTRLDTLFLITLTGRITIEELQTLLTTFDIGAPKWPHRSHHGNEE
jgi:hypothetical protein